MEVYLESRSQVSPTWVQAFRQIWVQDFSTNLVPGFVYCWTFGGSLSFFTALWLCKKIQHTLVNNFTFQSGNFSHLASARKVKMIWSLFAFKVLWLRRNASRGKFQARDFFLKIPLTPPSTQLDKTVFGVLAPQATGNQNQTNDRKQKRKELFAEFKIEFNQNSLCNFAVNVWNVAGGAKWFERSQFLQFRWNVFSKAS